MTDYIQTIKDLRAHIKALIAKYPCPIGGKCHCEVCVAEHALAYTSGVG